MTEPTSEAIALQAGYAAGDQGSEKPDSNAQEGVQVPSNAALHKLYLGLSERVEGMAGDLASNTSATKAIQSNTADLVDLFESAKGAFKVLEGIGKAAKPLMYISGLVGSVLTAYGAWKAHR